MTIRMKYFGMIAEQTGVTEESISVVDGCSVEELREHLQKKYPFLKSINTKVAVNQTVALDDVVLAARDEIALLPPFAGG